VTGRDFRAMLESKDVINTLLMADPIVGRLAQEVGFDALLVGGAATSIGVYGMPDGTIEVGEIVDQARRVRMLSNLPILLDIDDAGGTPPYIRRNVMMAEDVGAQALLIEDDDCPNRFLWDSGTRSWDHAHNRLRPVHAAADIISIAASCRRDARTVIVARTDALVTSSFDDALERGRAYVEAGAEAVFMYTLPHDRVAEVTAELGVPMMDLAIEELSPAGYEAIVGNGTGIVVHGSLVDLYTPMRESLSRIASLWGESSGQVPPTLWDAANQWYPGGRLA
jgi:2-methylisocitrate lyase-like PEP mutase family enzyme